MSHNSQSNEDIANRPTYPTSVPLQYDNRNELSFAEHWDNRFVNLPTCHCYKSKNIIAINRIAAFSRLKSTPFKSAPITNTSSLLEAVTNSGSFENASALRSFRLIGYSRFYLGRDRHRAKHVSPDFHELFPDKNHLQF